MSKVDPRTTRIQTAYRSRASPDVVKASEWIRRDLSIRDKQRESSECCTLYYIPGLCCVAPCDLRRPHRRCSALVTIIPVPHRTKLAHAPRLRCTLRAALYSTAVPWTAWLFIFIFIGNAQYSYPCQSCLRTGWYSQRLPFLHDQLNVAGGAYVSSWRSID